MWPVNNNYGRGCLQHPTKHETLVQCWFDVVPASQTEGQHDTNIGSKPRVYYVVLGWKGSYKSHSFRCNHQVAIRLVAFMRCLSPNRPETLCGIVIDCGLIKLIYDHWSITSDPAVAWHQLPSGGYRPPKSPYLGSFYRNRNRCRLLCLPAT